MLHTDSFRSHTANCSYIVKASKQAQEGNKQRRGTILQVPTSSVSSSSSSAAATSATTTMNIFKGTRFERTMKRLERRGDDNLPSPECNFFLSAVWIASGILAVLVPLIYRTIHKNKYEKLYMQYYWEEEMEAYEKQRQENYEMYGNNYAYNKYNGYGAYDMQEGGEQQAQQYRDVNNCHFWNWNCYPLYVNGEGERMEGQGMYPNWYNSFATSEEQLEEMENLRQQPGSMKFVYIWQLFMFIALIWYGNVVIRQNRQPAGLIVALFVWANYAFCAMWLLADGSIATDGWVVKRSGFYGQTSVLIFMSNFWYFIHGLVFCAIFAVRKMQQDSYEKKMEQSSKSVEAAEAESYRAPEETETNVSSVQRVPPVALKADTGAETSSPVSTGKESHEKDLLDAVFDPVEKACLGEA